MQKDAPNMDHQSKTYKRLRKWRSGIEGIISATKRAFGLSRCTWSGFESFQSYVTLADAILDRLIHNAHTITLKGDSMRKERAKDLTPAPTSGKNTKDS